MLCCCNYIATTLRTGSSTAVVGIAPALSSLASFLIGLAVAGAASLYYHRNISETRAQRSIEQSNTDRIHRKVELLSNEGSFGKEDYEVMQSSPTRIGGSKYYIVSILNILTSSNQCNIGTKSNWILVTAIGGVYESEGGCVVHVYAHVCDVCMSSCP